MGAKLFDRLTRSIAEGSLRRSLLSTALDLAFARVPTMVEAKTKKKPNCTVVVV